MKLNCRLAISRDIQHRDVSTKFHGKKKLGLKSTSKDRMFAYLSKYEEYMTLIPSYVL
jgi:hypothetical protein